MTTTDGKGRSILVVAADREDAGRFIVEADQELPAFSNSNPQLKPTGIIMSANRPEPDEELGSNRR